MNSMNAMNSINATNVTNAHSEEAFRLLSELHNSPNFTQRELAKNLNISLGKTNYIIRELIKKGIVKVKSFSHNLEKIKRIRYILTSKGTKEKLRLTYYFLKRKETEYNLIKNEWNTLVSQKKAEKVESRRGKTKR